MATPRLTRKEIKRPDQFISSTVRMLGWAKDHAAYLLYGVLGIVVMISLVVGWSAWQRHQYQKAERLLYEAVKLLKTSKSDADGQATDKTERDQAVQLLQTLTRDHGRTPAAASAHWHLGHHYYMQGDYASALAAYEQAQRLLRSDEARLIPALVTLNIGYTQEASGGCDTAIASFERILQTSVNWIHGEAFLGIGRCYEKSGATDQAKAVYARALSDDTISGDARRRLEQRQAYIARLGADGEDSRKEGTRQKATDTSETK